MQVILLLKPLFCRYKIPHTTASDLHTTASLTYQENNALRYATVYIPRALEKQLRKSTYPLKENLIAHLEEFVFSGLAQDTSEDFSTDWMNLIDREGLVHINETYLMMQHTEVELRSHLQSENIKY